MKNKKESFFSGTLIYTLGNLLVSGLAIITSPIFTRMMSVEDYGIYSLFNSWNSILFCVSSLGLSYSIAPAKKKYGDRIHDYTCAVGLVAIIIPLLLLIFSLLGMGKLLESIVKLPTNLILILWVELIFYTIIDFYNNKLAIIGDYKKYTLICVSRAFFSTILSIILVFLEKNNTYYGRVIGITVVSAVICGFIIRNSVKTPILNSEIKGYLQFAFPIAIPMIFHGLAMIILGQIDRIMIADCYTHNETGLYSYGYTIGTMIMFLLNASSMALKPFLYEKYKKDNDEINIQMNKMVRLMLIVCAMYVLVVPEVIKILADKKYWNTATLVYPIVVGCFCQYIYSYYCTFETIECKTKYIAIGSAIAAVINGGLNLLLLRRIGYEVAAFTTFVGYFVLMVFHMLICKYICKQDEILYGRYVLYASALFVLAFGANIIRNYWIIRYAILLLLLIYIYLKFKPELQLIIKKIRRE